MKQKIIDLGDTVIDSQLRSFWRLLAGYRGLYLVAVVSVGLAALAQTAIFYLLRYFIDRVLPNEALLPQVPLIAAGFVGLALLQGGFTFWSGRLAAETSESIALRLRNYLYDHIQRLSFTYHDNMQSGELLQRSTSDVDAVRRLFAEQAIGIGRISLLFLVNFIALLNLNAKLALLSVVVIPLILVISFYFFTKTGAVFESFQEQEAVLSNRLQEHLTGIRVVKAFARQQYEQDKFETDNWEKFRRGRRLTMMHAIFWPTTDVVSGLQMLAGFFLGAQMTIAGDITVGTYLAYMGFITQIIWPIRNLGRLISDISTGTVAFGRIKHILRENREPLDEGTQVPGPRGLRGAVRFEQVDFTYARETPVLQQVTFAVQPGQTVALLGATGSGKSSLVNLLPRFYEYSGGSITIDGVELRDYRRNELRQQIGIVQQEPFLFSATIRDNITYGVSHQVADEELFAAARAAAVHEVILSFPKGYDTLVGERGVTLSGGQKQRVTLARTFLRNPRILILDDATSSVDTGTEADIREALQMLMRNRTTFVIAHRIQTVMTADLVLVFENGRIVQRGTHDELVNQPGIYQQTYDLQARIEEELEADLAAVGVRSNGFANRIHQVSKR